MGETSFRMLRVWEESTALAIAVGRVVREFSPADRIDFGSQMVRAAVSVPSNIAEGTSRWSAQDQRRFFVYSRGSLNELETQLEIVAGLELVPEPIKTCLLHAIKETRRALSGLIRSTVRGSRRKGLQS